MLYKPYPFSRLPFFPIQAIEGIPENTALFFEFQSLQQFRDSLDEQAYGHDLKQSFLFRQLNQDLSFIESLLEEDSLKNQLLVKSPLVASLQSSGGDALHYLLVLETPSDELASSYVDHVVEQEGLRTQPSVYKNEIVYQLTSRSGETLSITSFRNLVMVGRYSLLVEESLNQLKQMKRHFLNDLSFRKKLMVEESVAQVYIKPSNFYMTMLPFLSASGTRKLESMKQWETWLGGDLILQKEGLQFKGHIKSKGKGLLRAIKKGRAGDRTEIIKALPDHVAMLSWFGYKSIQSYTKQGALKSNAVFDKYFVPWLSDHMAYVMTEPYSIGLDAERFLLFGVKNKERAEDYLDRMSEAEGELKAFNYMTFPVRRIMTDHFLESELWPRFSFKNPYVTFVENYLVVCQSQQALEVWIDKYLSGQMLNKQEAFLKYNQLIGDKTNFWQHIQPANIKHLLRTLTTDDFQDPLKRELKLIDNFYPIGLEIMKGGEINGYLHHESSAVAKNTSLLWKTRLNGKILAAPTIVKTPGLEPNEIWVQDESNFLHALSDEGNKLWNRKLDGPLLSKIHVLDFYHNRESHFLFNTAGKIYLVNRKGEDVGSFPIRLQSKATNGVLAVDFDRNKEYHFFVSCKNGNIYGFERTGRPLKGWNPQSDVGQVKFPMLHFQQKGNDYICALNRYGELYVFRRDGAKRFSPIKFEDPFLSGLYYDINRISSRIVSTDRNGMANIVGLTGSKFRLDLMAGEQKDVRFAFVDILGDIRKDYLIISDRSLMVLAYDGGSFSQQFEVELKQKPDEVFGVLAPGQKKGYIGICSEAQSQIHLYNSKGQMIKGFPLAGSTPFELVDLFKNNDLYLVVGNGESVYNYRIL